MLQPLHTSLADSFAQHQANILKSITHRLEVARLTHNRQLVESLEQEKRQYELEKVAVVPCLLIRLRRVIQQIFHHEQLIYEWHNGTDHSWFTFDPTTGQGVWGESEAELRLWLKEQWSEHCSKGY
jgi:hypothetical protein